MFVNSYLDMIGRVLRGEFQLIPELLDPEKVKRIFEADCMEIINAYRNGKISGELAMRNLFLLKSYVVSQLLTHSERLKRLAEEKGLKAEKRICAEDVNEIALMIDEREREL